MLEEDHSACWGCGTLLDTGEELDSCVGYKGVELMLPGNWTEVVRDDVLGRWQSDALPESIVVTVLAHPPDSALTLAAVGRWAAKQMMPDVDAPSLQTVEAAYARRHVIDATGFSSARQVAVGARVVVTAELVVIVVHAIDLSVTGSPSVGAVAIDASLQEHRQGILQSVLVVG